jgi:hypothetical protein
MVIAIIAIGFLVLAGAVYADWHEGDQSIYYQLPNSTGWDVYSEWGTGPLASQGYGAADDWTATTNGKVTGIHFWGSWKNDVPGETGQILVQIFSNDTSDPAFPRPDELLKSYVINEGGEGGYSIQPWSSSPTNNQGWYDPRNTDTWLQNNHGDIYQYNIPSFNDPNPLTQVAGQTYWLQISMDFLGCEWGWKTTESVHGNSATFWDSYNVWGPHCQWWRHPEIEWKWTQLKTPQGWCNPREPIDLAFVITPEPTTLLLLAAGAAMAFRKRKK